MSSTITARIEKGGYVHTLELTGHSRDSANREIAAWLLRIGYKPPRFFGLIKPRELKVFPKEVLQKMRQLA